MFTNQKVLGLLLITFIIGTLSYLAISQFKKDVSQVGASPSPSPSPQLDFSFNKSPSPVASGQPQPQAQTQERALTKNKKLAQFPGEVPSQELANKKAIIQTAKGMIELEIYPEASKAASNFLILAANGFYDGIVFHRVEDWVIQGGDPTGTGSGGPGYQFEDEPVTRPYVRGTLAMANAGPNTNGSQFFILKKDYPLDPNYTIFGQVISGIEVVDKIAVGDVMQTVVVQPLN